MNADTYPLVIVFPSALTVTTPAQLTQPSPPGGVTAVQLLITIDTDGLDAGVVGDDGEPDPGFEPFDEFGAEGSAQDSNAIHATKADLPISERRNGPPEVEEVKAAYHIGTSRIVRNGQLRASAAKGRRSRGD